MTKKTSILVSALLIVVLAALMALEVAHPEGGAALIQGLVG